MSSRSGDNFHAYGRRTPNSHKIFRYTNDSSRNRHSKCSGDRAELFKSYILVLPCTPKDLHTLQYKATQHHCEISTCTPSTTQTITNPYVSCSCVDQALLLYICLGILAVVLCVLATFALALAVSSGSLIEFSENLLWNTVEQFLWIDTQQTPGLVE